MITHLKYFPSPLRYVGACRVTCRGRRVNLAGAVRAQEPRAAEVSKMKTAVVLFLCLVLLTIYTGKNHLKKTLF